MCWAWEIGEKGDHRAAEGQPNVETLLKDNFSVTEDVLQKEGTTFDSL